MPVPTQQVPCNSPAGRGANAGSAQALPSPRPHAPHTGGDPGAERGSASAEVISSEWPKGQLESRSPYSGRVPSLALAPRAQCAALRKHQSAFCHSRVLAFSRILYK